MSGAAAAQIITAVGVIIVGVVTVWQQRSQARDTNRTERQSSQAQVVATEAARVSKVTQEIIDDLRADADRYRAWLLDAEKERDDARAERRQALHDLASKESALQLAQHLVDELTRKVSDLEAQLADCQKGRGR